MIRTIDIDQVNNSIQAVIALTRNGDEVLLEKNGEPVVRVIPVHEKAEEIGQRTAGLGKGYWMSDDFDAELSDEFWGLGSEL